MTQATYYAANAERIKARVYDWRLADLRRRAALFMNERARKKGIEGRVDWRDLPSLPGPCHYCGAEATGFDHVIPFALRGPNEIENLVRCCRTCNERKNKRLDVSQLLLPREMTVLCGWCWAPIVRRLTDINQAARHGRTSFACSAACRNRAAAFARFTKDGRGSAVALVE